MREVNVGTVQSFGDPCRKVIDSDGVEVGVFKLDGEFFAYENVCPHLGGPVCQGMIIAKVEEVVADDRTSKGLEFSKTKINMVCPWHGYEFDIRTGQSPRQSELSAQTHQSAGGRRRRDRDAAAKDKDQSWVATFVKALNPSQ